MVEVCNQKLKKMFNNRGQVETIGDAYMVASGVPDGNEKHAVDLTQVALDLLTKVDTYEVDHKPR